MLRALLAAAAALAAVIIVSTSDLLREAGWIAWTVAGAWLLVVAKAWSDLSRTSGTVVAWDRNGWTVDGASASLHGHAILGPLISLEFHIGRARRDLLVAFNVADHEALRRLRIHLRAVHREEAPLR